METKKQEVENNHVNQHQICATCSMCINCLQSDNACGNQICQNGNI